MSDTKIGQVRIHTNTDDPLAARMRGDAALRALDLEPPGMPARTILCIRSMADPLPGGLDLRSAHAPRATEWERAARSAINDAMHRAVRVVDGAVPANADAVLFADRAELLACAARDVVRGGGGWWWRDTIRGGLSWTHVVREWLRAPEYVPAALELLVRSGDVVAFVCRLETAEAVELTENVLRVHALEALARRIVESIAAASPVVRRTAIVAVPPLVRKLVPEVISTSSIETVEQPLFAAITLALRRAPAIVRGETFARQVSEWIGQPDLKRPVAATTITKPSPRRRTTNLSTSEEQAIPVVQPANEEQRRADFSPPPPSARASRAAHELDGLKPVLRSTARPRRKTTAAAPSAPVAVPVEAIHSEYAGLFFLLNLAIALGYYDPYGRETPLDLDIWDFLALTGQALLWSAAATPPLSNSGASAPQASEYESGGDCLRTPNEDDAIWPLLAHLSSRASSEGPGREGHEAHPSRPARPGPSLDARDDRRLPPEILTRVREALALVVDSEDPAAFVIRRPGRIDLSPAHIDVTFCLAAHPIEIRVAGLDRDPGWIPAAGRHVAFHFD